MSALIVFVYIYPSILFRPELPFTKSMSFETQGNLGGGEGSISPERHETRQAVLRHFEQKKPFIAQYLTENPGFFDALLDMADEEPDQSPTMSKDDLEPIQSVSPQLVGYLTGC